MNQGPRLSAAAPFHEVPMNTEKLLTLIQLQDDLAEILPERPARRTLYTWMEAKENPMPFVAKPSSGKGTGKRTGRWFMRSHVREWLLDPVGYWARRTRKVS